MPNKTYDLIDGISSTLAAERLKTDGFNELPRHEKRGALRILLEVFRQPMFALLIGAGLVYLLLGDLIEALFLLAFASLSVTITIIQESRSENVLEKLRNLASPRALVIRDGAKILIAGREVVREDIILISEGDRVAADAILLSSHDLLVDESLLTGESVAVRKLPHVQTDGNSDLLHSLLQNSAAKPGGDDTPHVFAGTLVVRGTGKALVYSTGVHSEMGKIGRTLITIETEQPHLQIQLQSFIRVFALIGGIAGAMTIILFGLLRGTWLEAMLSGIAVGMSLLPEEFPLVMTVFMAMGAWRISRARVLTRRASAIETLGATTVLCTDKTGTLTENRMTVVALIGDGDTGNRGENIASSSKEQEILKVALRACADEPNDPMDIAIHALAKDVFQSEISKVKQNKLIHIYGLRPDLFVVANVFSSMNEGSLKHTVYAKGAVEAIAEICHLSADQLDKIKLQAEALAVDGIRVLGTAMVASSSELSLPESPRGFTFEYTGLIGFADPLRNSVPAAVAECRSAGIRVIMITGDYPATASAIGKQAGIDTQNILTGDDIDAMSNEQLSIQVKSTSIFARIRPNQKLRIVNLLKRNGEIVAMTGDGVNDAPAIKAAHIGIAMGGRGTDVAREASAIVLLDDDFSSIVKTIRLGRRIYDNLRKAIEFIVAVHIPIAGLALLPLLLGLPLMLTPVHIAFLEMVIDPACSVVLEAEKEEDNVMQRPPRDPLSPLLLPKRIIWATLQGLIAFGILAFVLITAARMKMPEPDLRALIFTSLVLINMSLILVNRSFSASLVRAILKPNRALWLLLGGVSALLAISIFWPPAQSLFKFGKLHWNDLLICLSIGFLSLIALQALKSKWFQLQK